MAKDRLGQEVKVGDWCAITQHNEIYVGKVIKCGNTVTIAQNIREAFIIQNKLGNWRNYEKNKKMFESAFPGMRFSNNTLSFVRDNKFIKITPTRQMELDYENI